jgi:hypothetical protein
MIGIDNKRINNFIIFNVILFLGSLIRIFFIVNSNFPLNDGGMFYTMINELVAHDFNLPVFTSYNHNNIPFTITPYYHSSTWQRSVLKYCLDFLFVMRVLTIVVIYFDDPCFLLPLSRKYKLMTHAILFAHLNFCCITSRI